MALIPRRLLDTLDVLFGRTPPPPPTPPVGPVATPPPPPTPPVGPVAAPPSGGNNISVLGNDGMIDRNREGRSFVAITTILLSTVALPAIGYAVIGWPGVIIGLAAGVKLVFYLAPRFIIDVPQAQIYVTVNALRPFFGLKGDPNVVYGPGKHLAYPWETRRVKGNLSGEILTLDFTDEVPGKNTKLAIKAKLQFRVDIRIASHFVGVDQKTIQGGIVSLIKAMIGSKLAIMTADKAKKDILLINSEVFAHFGITPPPTMTVAGAPAPAPATGITKSLRVTELEEQYGIEVVAITIEEIDLPERVQATRDALDQAKQVFKGVANILGTTESKLRHRLDSKDISLEQYNSAVESFFVQAGTADMKVTSFKMNNMKELGETLARLFGK